MTWAFIKDTTQAALIEQFIARFPQSAHRREAEARLAELRRLAAAAPPPPAPPVAPPPQPGANMTAVEALNALKALEQAWGMELALLDETLRNRHQIDPAVVGVAVETIFAGTPASEKNIAAGLVIVEVAQEAVSAPADIARVVARQQAAGRRSVLLLVANTRNDLRFLALAIPDTPLHGAPGAAPSPPPGATSPELEKLFKEFFDRKQAAAAPPADAPAGTPQPPRWARLGVRIQTVDQSLADSLGLPKPVGALVAGVDPGSPAEQAGLKVGDVVLSLDRAAIGVAEDLSRLVGAAEPGQRIELLIVRDKAQMRLAVTLASLPADAPAAAAPPAPAGPAFSASRAAAPLAPTEESTLKPKDSFRECADCPEMVVVPAGDFLMGSPANEPERSGDEGPQRRVTIAKPFAVGKFEITFAEWDACVADGGCHGYGATDGRPDDRGWGRGRRPVIKVSHWRARTYIEWLNRKAGSGAKYRLLTEGEWEYAARAGTTTPFAFGRTISTDDANYDGRRAYAGGRRGVSRRQTMPVGSFKPNAFGLYDMHGNVREWVADCYLPGYEGRGDDAKAATKDGCTEHVWRGGAYHSTADELRSAWRYYRHTHHEADDPGFRVARTLEP